MASKPNLFIVGAPKSGTTAMSEYLRSHPNVFMSDPKEPCFFSKEIVPSNYRTMNEYMELFAYVAPEQSVVAEASTNYMQFACALEKIKEFQPEAKVMVMLRRPADLVYAYHGQMLKQGYELERDFEKAWRLQSRRATGKVLTRRGKYRDTLLQYRWIGSLGSQVANMLRIFPKNQVHVTFFEDFLTDPGLEYRRLLSFLELPDDGRVEFPRINESSTYRWLRLGQFSRRLRHLLSGLLNALRRATGFRGTGMLRMLDGFNVEIRPRTPLRPEFLRYLDEVFSDEVIMLEQLVGRSLPAWRGESLEDSTL